MRFLRPSAGLAGVAAAGLFATVAWAQQAPPSQSTPTTPKKQVYGGLTFWTKVGSFKVLGAGEDPTEGKLTMSFTGTVLISQPTPETKVTVTGNVRREIHDTKHGKTVYHGKGTLVFDGKARGIQFFGRDLKARFFGFGAFRLYGEFDKNLETGFFQLDGSPEKRPRGTGGMTVNVPSQEQRAPKPKVRINPSGG